MSPSEHLPPEAAPVNSPAWWEHYLARHWDANDGGGQTRHFMQRLIAALPAPERDYLASAGPSILDWGCAHGEGVDELARAFPGAQVTGLDIAASGIAAARQRFPDHEFLCTPDGVIPRRFDVVVTSNCLEHFAEPLAVLASLAAAADRLLLVLVPFAEEPLCEYHVARFDDTTFPAQFEGFRRLAALRVTVDPRYWAGEQLLVVYGSPTYVLERGLRVGAASERAKWDAYYAGREPETEPAEIAEFNQEFLRIVDALLPDGGRVLEAGAGDGWQSLALARSGRYQVTLQDFSAEALRHARTRFAQAGLTGEFVLGDATAVGEPEFDLVFNAGVLEHFGFDDQVRFVRGMASRSRRYVLSLVPNRRCPWYWLWRLQVSRHGGWPYGQEFPAVEMASVFQAAGLRVLGEQVVGASWAERFLVTLQGIDADLLRDLLTLHRAPILGTESKGYLLATLAVVQDAPLPPELTGWGAPAASSGQREDLLAGALADALALQLAAHGKLVGHEREERRSDQERARADAAHIASLTAEADRLRQALADLQARLAEAESSLHSEKARSAELSARIERQAHEMGEIRSARDDLAGRAAQLAARMDDMERWIAQIRKSRTFRLLRTVDRLRGRNADEGP